MEKRIVLATEEDLRRRKLAEKVGLAGPRVQPGGILKADVPIEVVKQCMGWGGHNALATAEGRLERVEELVAQYLLLCLPKGARHTNAEKKKALGKVFTAFAGVMGELRAAMLHLPRPPRNMAPGPPQAGKPLDDTEVRPAPVGGTETREEPCPEPARVEERKEKDQQDAAGITSLDDRRSARREPLR